MKKICLFVFLFVSVFSLFSHSQKLEKAKALLDNRELLKAKTEIDAFLSIEKNQLRSEAYFQKAKIYLAISKDPTLKDAVADPRSEAFSAIQEYLQLEESEKNSTKRYMLMLFEGYQPLVDVYSGYSTDGAILFNSGNYGTALQAFKKNLEVFKLLFDRKVVAASMDTTTLLYAAIAAEKSGKAIEAADYYSKVAATKVKTEGFAEVYKWLANYHSTNNDITKALQFSALGKELYPADPFWLGFDLETLRDKGSKEELFNKYEEILRAYPDSVLFLFNYGIELYQTAYHPHLAKRPINSKSMIDKSASLMKRIVEKNPNYVSAYVLLGQIYYNEGVDVNNEMFSIVPKSGTTFTTEQLKKRNELRSEVLNKFNLSAPYLIKVYELLSSQSKLTSEDRYNLKNTLDLLISVNEEKISQLKYKKHQTESKKDLAGVKLMESELKILQNDVAKYTDLYNGKVNKQ